MPKEVSKFNFQQDGQLQQEWGEQSETRQEEEKSRRKKIKIREKVEKSRKAVFFQCFVAPEGRKVGSLKWRVQSHQGRREIN